MPRFAPVLALLLLFSCSKKSEEVTSPLVGRWTLVAQQDSARAWVNFIPFVPVQLEFRADGTFDYVEPNGKPKRECCQPMRYSFAVGTTTPSFSSFWIPSTITFTDVVSCPTVKCASPRTWTVIQVTDQFLDVAQETNGSKPAIFRYQRIR